jgi:hypothetical protein
MAGRLFCMAFQHFCKTPQLFYPLPLCLCTPSRFFLCTTPLPLYPLALCLFRQAFPIFLTPPGFLLPLLHNLGNECSRKVARTSAQSALFMDCFATSHTPSTYSDSRTVTG